MVGSVSMILSWAEIGVEDEWTNEQPKYISVEHTAGGKDVSNPTHRRRLKLNFSLWKDMHTMKIHHAFGFGFGFGSRIYQ